MRRPTFKRNAQRRLMSARVYRTGTFRPIRPVRARSVAAPTALRTGRNCRSRSRRSLVSAAACRTGRGRRVSVPTVWKMPRLTREAGLTVPPGVAITTSQRRRSSSQPLATAKLRRALEQHDRGNAVRADEDVEPRAAHADRARRRDDLIGLGLRLAADPAEGAARRVQRELVEGLRIVEDEAIDDDGRIAADGELRAVSEREFTQPALRGGDALVTIDGRLDRQRTGCAGDGRLDERRLSDLLLGKRHRRRQKGGCSRHVLFSPIPA